MAKIIRILAIRTAQFLVLCVMCGMFAEALIRNS